MRVSNNMKVYIRIIGKKPLCVREYKICCSGGLKRTLKDNNIDLKDYCIYYQGKQCDVIPEELKHKEHIALIKKIKIPL